MIKSLKDIKKQEEILLNRHTNLSNLKVESVKYAFIEKDKFLSIANYIENSWKDTYKKNSRLKYSPGYLKWVFNKEGIESDLSVALINDLNQVVGLFLFSPRTVLINNKIIKSGIQTGLSISPKNKREGAAKYLHLQVQKRALEKIDAHFYWYDSSINIPLSSYKIFTKFEKKYFNHWGDFSLKARIFDYDRAIANHDFRMFEKPILKIFSGKPTKRGKKNIQKITPENISECTSFINGYTRQNNCGRLFNEDELLKYACSSFKDHQCIGWCSRKAGKLNGVAVGFTIKTIGKSTEEIFFLDMINVRKDGELSDFIKEIEFAVAHSTDCFCILTPDPQLKLSHGYLPSGSKISCYNIFYYGSVITSPNKEKLYIDHK